MKHPFAAIGAAALALALTAAPALARPHYTYRPAPSYNYGRYSSPYGGNYEAPYQHGTIGGVVLGFRAGYVAEMRLDSGEIIPVNERTLLRYGYGLAPGRHYQIYGYYGNGAFVADQIVGG